MDMTMIYPGETNTCETAEVKLVIPERQPKLKIPKKDKLIAKKRSISLTFRKDFINNASYVVCWMRNGSHVTPFSLSEEDVKKVFSPIDRIFEKLV